MARIPVTKEFGNVAVMIGGNDPELFENVKGFEVWAYGYFVAAVAENPNETIYVELVGVDVTLEDFSGGRRDSYHRNVEWGMGGGYYHTPIQPANHLPARRKTVRRTQVPTVRYPN